MPRRWSLTIASASTECTPLVSWVRSTLRRMITSSSRGGSISTPTVRNFCRMLAYMTSWMALRRSSARISFRRWNNTRPPSSEEEETATFLFRSPLAAPAPGLSPTSMDPPPSSLSRSSEIRSSVASTAEANKWGSEESTCASSCPEGDRGESPPGAPTKGGASSSSSSSPRAAGSFHSEAAVTMATRRRRGTGRPERGQEEDAERRTAVLLARSAGAAKCVASKQTA
mmetsp:Transcript_2055/g.4768  ORF Transcript_2055/g.4768 Transcript_2055/m.4768 type:complete len:228 (+) Transcript_2055:860-1543(+)